MNDLFRARAIEFWTQKELDEIRPSDYMYGVFPSDDLIGELGKLFRDDCARHRFMNIVHREEDANVWAKFVRHEQNRADSAWDKRALKTVADDLERWRESLEKAQDPAAVVDPIVRKLPATLALAPEECVRFGLRAFRDMLRRFCGGDR